ncbi:hypothetical protein [Pedobacter sp.]|uniref:hypothetical protein n=1 Tax=Pedobacter sp. TaxID=1411316 RepID=UPI003D7FFEE6
MDITSLEITENQYCIKLDKASFDLSLIRKLINRIQAEQHFFNRNNSSVQDDIISRAGRATEDENFDRLCDK